MPAFTTAVLAAIALATSVSAHGHIRGITSAGNYFLGADPSFQYQPENQRPDVAGWSAQNLDNGFVDPVYNSPDMICHKSATPGKSSIEVAAGSSITLHWNTWPNSHKGPVIDYLANARGEFSSISKTSLQFVKIAEAGLSGGSWAADRLIANNNSWAVTIPSTIAPGNYVLRHEIIALHSAQTAGGAQNYPQCINLKVTGSGSNSLSSGTLGTALYTGNEPGIIFNLYNNPTSYPIPGPQLMAGGGSNNGGTTPTSSNRPMTTTSGRAATATTLSTATRSSAAPATTTSGNAGTAALYAQCGGSGWTEATSCVSGAVCKKQNDYYSQCVPN